MNEAILEFIKKLAEDEGLQAQFQEITDPDEAYALASSVQEGFTKEELCEAMAKIREAVPEDDNLDVDDLKAISGGVDTVAAIGFGVSSGIGVGVGAAAAALVIT